MTDNDIVKLLKVCSTASGCKNCPFADSTDCAGEVSSLALNLINRQKAEILELKRYIENLEQEAELKWEREVMQDDR